MPDHGRNSVADSKCWLKSTIISLTSSTLPGNFPLANNKIQNINENYPTIDIEEAFEGGNRPKDHYVSQHVRRDSLMIPCRIVSLGREVEYGGLHQRVKTHEQAKSNR
jgi:hypothetical protein